MVFLSVNTVECSTDKDAIPLCISFCVIEEDGLFVSGFYKSISDFTTSPTYEKTEKALSKTRLENYLAKAVPAMHIAFYISSFISKLKSKYLNLITIIGFDIARHIQLINNVLSKIIPKSPGFLDEVYGDSPLRSLPIDTYSFYLGMVSKYDMIMKRAKDSSDLFYFNDNEEQTDEKERSMKRRNEYMREIEHTIANSMGPGPKFQLEFLVKQVLQREFLQTWPEMLPEPFSKDKDDCMFNNTVNCKTFVNMNKEINKN